MLSQLKDFYNQFFGAQGIPTQCHVKGERSAMIFKILRSNFILHFANEQKISNTNIIRETIESRSMRNGRDILYRYENHI